MPKNLWNSSLIINETLIQCFHQSTLDFDISNKQTLNVSWVEILYNNNSREDWNYSVNRTPSFSFFHDIWKRLYPFKIFQDVIALCLHVEFVLLSSATSEIFATSFLPWDFYVKQKSWNALICCLTQNKFGKTYQGITNKGLQNITSKNI